MSLMHLPNVKRDALIFPASLCLSPIVFAFLLRSEPAKSQNDML